MFKRFILLFFALLSLVDGEMISDKCPPSFPFMEIEDYLALNQLQEKDCFQTWKRLRRENTRNESNENSKSSNFSDLTQFSNSLDTMTFYYVTDPHWDWDYCINCTVASECRSGTGGPAGYYGYADKDSHCQPPLTLLQSALTTIRGMVAENEEGILLVPGDFVKSGNTKHNVTLPTLYSKFNHLGEAMNDIITDKFTVVPVIGNHDIIPEGKFPPESCEFYRNLTDIWIQLGWVDEDQRDVMSRGGYFEKLVGNMAFIVLNTCMWVETNELVKDIDDPAGQFDWLERTLEKYSSKGIHAWLLGHCYPGMVIYYADYADRYDSILSKYSNVISFQLYGHLHHSIFNIVMDNNGTGTNATGSGWVASSISPDNGAGGPHSPSFGYFDVDSTTMVPQSLQTFILNLTLANADPKHAQWVKDYNTKNEPYNIKDLSGASMLDFWQRLHEDDLFAVFWKRFFSDWLPSSDYKECNFLCQRVFLCSMRYLRPWDFAKCVF